MTSEMASDSFSVKDFSSRAQWFAAAREELGVAHDDRHLAPNDV
jgi:hypothetical protein